MSRRIDVKAILSDPEQRKRLLVDAGLALQHREGIVTTQEQMEAAYNRVQAEMVECPRCGLRAIRSAWGQTCGRCFADSGVDYPMQPRDG